jgi:hypothetical protein
LAKEFAVQINVGQQIKLVFATLKAAKLYLLGVLDKLAQLIPLGDGAGKILGSRRRQFQGMKTPNPYGDVLAKQRMNAREVDYESLSVQHTANVATIQELKPLGIMSRSGLAKPESLFQVCIYLVGVRVGRLIKVVRLRLRWRRLRGVTTTAEREGKYRNHHAHISNEKIHSIQIGGDRPQVNPAKPEPVQRKSETCLNLAVDHPFATDFFSNSGKACLGLVKDSSTGKRLN